MPNKEKTIARVLWIILLLSAVIYGFVFSSYPESIFAASLAFVIVITLVGAVNSGFAYGASRAERKRAELAEGHIEELRHYIAEQDRTTVQLQKSKDKFHHAAFHDALTNLPNRNLFLEKLQFLLEKSKQQDDFNFAVLFLDLNRFKTLNESLGHSTGDKLIRHVAKRLENCVREEDLVARFSGDEFAIILSNVAGVEDAVTFANRVKKALTEPFIVGSREVFTSVSVGIALNNRSYREAEELLRDADIAMYCAKDAGKDHEIFDPQMHTRAVRLHQFETDLRFAIEREQLNAYYQPIIDLETLNLSGFEALIRWNHPKRGMVSPTEFIPIAEETGLIVPLTLWMLRRSCRQLINWQKKSPLYKNLLISVNLSGKHFIGENIVQQIGQILFDTGLDPGCLKLEITESAVMENPEDVISMLIQLKSLGVQLSIDDFGTGYSSLSYLHRFPMDTLKVDRSFVSAMDEGSENGEIVKTIVSLAKTLRMNVIAEGIETIHQLHQLRILGCEYGQGYLFSRPLPAEEAEKLLEDQTRWKNVIPVGGSAAAAASQLISQKPQQKPPPLPPPPPSHNNGSHLRLSK